MSGARHSRRSGELSIDAKLTIRMGNHRAKLTGRGGVLRLTAESFGGAVAMYRGLPSRLGAETRKQLVGRLHRELRARGVSLQITAGRLGLGSIGTVGPTGLLALIVR